MTITEQEQVALTLRVDEDGTIVVPREVCEARGLEPGDTIEMEISLNGILLVPVVTDEELEAFWGPNIREELRQSAEDIAAGRAKTTFYGSTEEFLAALDARSNANARRD